MADPRQQDTASATSSQTKTQQPSPNNTKSPRAKKTKKRAEPVDTAPRQPDEIEEAETTIPVKTAPPKAKQKRVESSDEDDDSDGAESVYLSDDDEETSSDEESTDSDSNGSVEELPPRQLTRRQTDRGVKNTNTQGSPYTITQTRSETTRWITTQNNGNNGPVTRGTRTVNEQTTMHGQNVNGSRQTLNRNSVSFNMSINVDMSFTGLVTGRNLGFTGGSLSYAWNRRSTQGG